MGFFLISRKSCARNSVFPYSLCPHGRGARASTTSCRGACASRRCRGLRAWRFALGSVPLASGVWRGVRRFFASLFLPGPSDPEKLIPMDRLRLALRRRCRLLPLILLALAEAGRTARDKADECDLPAPREADRRVRWQRRIAAAWNFECW